eukprot:100978_1
MAQGKFIRKNGGGTKKKSRRKKAQQRKQRQKMAFAKLPRFKKKQLSQQKLKRTINNKNHDIAVQVAMGHGESLRIVGNTKNTHVKKFKVKQ